MNIQVIINKYYSKRAMYLDQLAEITDIEQRATIIKQSSLVNEMINDLNNIKNTTRGLS